MALFTSGCARQVGLGLRPYTLSTLDKWGRRVQASSGLSVRDLASWTILPKDDPNHLRLRCTTRYVSIKWR